VEHYARVYFSELLFSYPPLHKHGWDTDQGRLWIRYGQPLAGRQISASDDFMEAENLLDPLKYNRRWQWTFLINGRLETLTFVDLIGNGYIRLTPIGEGYSDFKAFELALETPQQVAREWTAQPIQVFRAPFVARGGNGKAELTLFLAVPYDQFSYTNERGHAVCQVGCRLAAIDRRGTTTFCDSQSNMLIISPTLSLNPDFYHAFKLQAQLPADSLMLAWAVEQIDAGKITIQKMPLETYDFADKGFHMSSLLLLSRAGEAEQGSIFNRRGRKLIPNFTGNFTSGDTLRVYYEIEDLPTNLRGRTRYRFSYAIEELSTSRGLIASLAGFLATRQPHRITHSEEKGDIRTEINEYLNIPLADLPAGRYRFTLEIEELIIGKTLSRAADFSIINAQDKP